MPLKAPPIPPTRTERLIAFSKKNPKTVGVLCSVLLAATVVVARAEIQVVMETSHAVCTAGKPIELQLRTNGWSLRYLIFSHFRGKRPKVFIERMVGTLKHPVEVLELDWNPLRKIWAVEWQCHSDPLPALFVADAKYLKQEVTAKFTVVSPRGTALSRKLRPDAVARQ